MIFTSNFRGLNKWISCKPCPIPKIQDLLLDPERTRVVLAALPEEVRGPLLEDWRKLSTSDHLYYMCTKHWEDGSVHRYFSPYDSPYDAYINFMNVLDNVRTRLAEG